VRNEPRTVIRPTQITVGNQTIALGRMSREWREGILLVIYCRDSRRQDRRSRDHGKGTHATSCRI